MTTIIDFLELLGPMSTAEFFCRHWERSPMMSHITSERASTLVSVSDIDALLAAAPMMGGTTGHPTVSAVRADGPCTLDAGLRADGSGHIAPADAHAAIDSGHTLIINGIGRTWAPAAATCRALENHLQHPVGCNLFLTPARAQGFVAHADAMDTFFVQVAGAKRWKVWQPTFELPFGERLTKPVRAELGDPVIDVELGPGDVLYLPRGWVHEGIAGQSRSLHLTFGIATVRWLDLVRRYLELAASHDRRLREALPLSPDQGESAEAIANRVDGLIRSVERACAADALTGVLAETLARRPSTLERPQPGLPWIPTAPCGIDSQTPLARPAGLFPLITRVGDSVTIHFAGGSLTGPAEAEPAMQFVATRSEFTPAELPGMPAAVQLDFAAALVEHGMLTAGAAR